MWAEWIINYFRISIHIYLKCTISAFSDLYVNISIFQPDFKSYNKNPLIEIFSKQLEKTELKKQFWGGQRGHIWEQHIEILEKLVKNSTHKKTANLSEKHRYAVLHFVSVWRHKKQTNENTEFSFLPSFEYKIHFFINFSSFRIGVILHSKVSWISLIRTC